MDDSSEKPGEMYPVQEPLEGLVTAHENSLALPERVSRNVVLACVLEPIPDKPGCTTRYRDLKDTKTLEMFMTAAVNSGPPFAHLAEYLLKEKTPGGSYRFIREAMIASKALRNGGKINQGMLEFLAPVVMANVLYDPGCSGTPQELFPKAADVLRRTNREDVKSLIEMKKIGNIMSNVQHKYEVREHNVDNVFDYYREELEIEKATGKLTSIAHNAQFVEGFEEVAISLKTFLESRKPKFSERAVEAYNSMFKKPGYEKLGIGLAADLIAVTFYLAFAYSKGQEIIN